VNDHDANTGAAMAALPTGNNNATLDSNRISCCATCPACRPPRSSTVTRPAASVGWLVLVVAFGILISFPRLYAQATVGIQPLGTYQVNQLDTISMSDLGLHISIPLYLHKARGASNGLHVVLRYDTPRAPIDPLDVGWKLDVSTASGGNLVITNISSGDCSGLGNDGYYHNGTYNQYSYTFYDDTGYGHPFSGYSTVADNCGAGWSTTSLNESAADGTGYSLVATGLQATATDLSGTKYTPSQMSTQIVDSNGNSGYVQVDEGPYPIAGYYGTFTDTSNVSLTVSGGGYTSDQYGNLLSRAPAYVQYVDSSGKTQTITIDYKMHNIDYGSTGTEVGLVDSVSYPDGSSYHFGYQSSSCASNYSGALASVQLPTGGTISYENSPTRDCTAGLTQSLTRTTADGSTTYTEVDSQNHTEATTTVAHADGSSETIHFVKSMISLGNADSMWITLETAHSRQSASGSTLKATMKCYNGSSGDCTTTPITVPVTKIATTTTLTNVPSSKVVEVRNANGLTTELDEYDFGGSSPSRKTITAYAALGNIQNRPHTVSVYDAGSNLVSQTTYGYDEYSLASSGVSGLAAVSGSRGNQTTITWRISSSLSTSTHDHYDDAGQIVNSTNARGYVTSYLHDVTDTYVTQTTYPPVAAGTFSEVYTPDPNTGLIVLKQDVNGNKTGYLYDSMLRTIGICNPDGGYVKTVYTPTNKTVMRLSGTGVGCTPGGGEPTGNWITSSEQHDGYGRLSHSTDEAGYISDVGYDSMGRRYSVSNPHVSDGATTGTIYYLYDALGRKVKETAQDNLIQYWCYDGVRDSIAMQPNCNGHIGSKTGTWVDFRNEAGNDWQRTTDALGRLAEVVEPNGTSSGPSLETDYTYDPLGDLTCVEQHGGVAGTGCSAPQSSDASSPWHVRRFTYDGVSHLIQAHNPESGWSCYGTTGGAAPNGNNCSSGYDNNGNFVYKTDARGVMVSSTYDAWDRVTAKSYNDGVTATATFGYDGLDVAGNRISWSSNAVGRVSQTSVANVNAAMSFSYDPMGRVAKKSECIPGDCSGDINVGATYYFQGPLHTLTNGSASHPITWTYTYDSGNRLQTVSSSTTADSINKLFDASSASPAAYGPEGLEYAQIGFNSSTNQPFITFKHSSDVRFRPMFSGYYNSSGTAIYTYCMPSPANPNCSGQSSAYTPDGSVATVDDSATGNWTYGYDTLGRIVSGAASGGPYNGKITCYTYDAFGNRTTESLSSGNCDSDGYISWALYNQSNTNRIDDSGVNQDQIDDYDRDGNPSFDGGYFYLYDGEGRVCAIRSLNTTAATGYVYDADGERVGKGTLTSFSCNLSTNGFATTNAFVIGLDGGQLTEINGSKAWQHTNLFLDGQLFATYKSSHLYFSLNDWLGTRRAEVSSSGCTATTYSNLPYGDQLVTSGGGCPYITEQHFTGKERDGESGNDYFGARYYASSMGRWVSPDPTQLWYADPSNPQSLNLYGYAWNNPNKYVDNNGEFINLPLAGIGAGVGFATGFLGSAISQEISNGKVNWGTAAAYGLGGAATGALAGFTFGGSLLVTAVADVGIATVGNAAGGIISRSLTDLHSDPSLREDPFSDNAIGTDLATGFAGGVIGEAVGLGYKVVNATAAPKAPTPFGNMTNNLKRLAKMRAWEAAQEKMENRAVAYNAVTGALAGNVGIQAWSAWNSRSNNSSGWHEFDRLELEFQNRSECARTVAYDSQGNSTGWSGCQ
jgi:RHS repeat-associated protein